MSFVTTEPEMLAATAGNLAGIGSTLAARNAAAATSTTGVIPAAADQVSTLTAAQFTAYGHAYQTVSSQANAVLQLFVQTLSGSADSYAVTEAANAVVAG